MILDRYIAREIIQPLIAVLAVLLVIFVGYSSGRYLSDAVNGLLPVDTLTSLIALRAVIALEVLLPVAFYLSVVLGLGRMYGDHEMTALTACGVGVLRVLKVVVRIAAVLAVLVALLSLLGRPWAYEQSYWIKARAEAEIDFDKLAPGTFYEGGNADRVIFAEDVDRANNELGNVFIASEKGEVVRVIHARRVKQLFDADTGSEVLALSDTNMYELRRRGTRDLLGHFDRATVRLQAPGPVEVGYKRKAAPTAALAASDAPVDVAEWQWRLSTPVSTILLGVLGVVVSRAGAGRNRYGTTLAAVLIYAVYYNLNGVAKTWIEQSIVGPVPGIWWVHLLLGAVLILALLRPVRGFPARRGPLGPGRSHAGA